MNKDFKIIKYYMNCIMVEDDYRVVYEKFYGQRTGFRKGHEEDPRNKIIPAAEARRLIAENTMVKVLENQHGTIWEMPE